jgi:hypothetical protein
VAGAEPIDFLWGAARYVGGNMILRYSLLGFMVFAAWPAMAQTLQDLQVRHEAFLKAWEETPLTQKRVVFVTTKPNAYGAFEERPNNVFKRHEPLHTYAEPVGYLWKTVGPDTYQFGLNVDFLILSPDGEVLGGKEDFLHYSQVSHERNTELMLNLELTLNDAPPGDYIVRYTIHDQNSDKVSTFQQPFKIVI